MKREMLTYSERRVLSQLDKNSRESFRKIGKKIRMSQQNVSYTVKSLSERGVIKNFYTLIDYSMLSVLNFRVFFKINQNSEEKFNKMIEYFVKNDHTMWVSMCGGRHDLLCTFGAYNPSHFNKILRKTISSFPEQIDDYSILTTIVIRTLEREYLTAPKRSHKEIIIGGDREPVKLSERDLRIISEIADDARKNSVDISKKLSCEPKTVINRIKFLEKMQIINGYRPFIDFSKTGHVTVLLMIKYHNISIEDENRLTDYLYFHPNVTCITRTLGEWDIEIRIEARDIWNLKKIEREIRHRFAAIIQDTETVPIYREYKRTFFPRFILEKKKHPKQNRFIRNTSRDLKPIKDRV